VFLTIDPERDTVKRMKAGAYTRSLFSSTLSAFCGIGAACSGSSGGVCEVSGHMRGCLGCLLCQKRLRLSWKVDECKAPG